MFVAPIAGALSDRIGGGLIMGVGLTLQAIGLAWLGLVSSTTVEYSALIAPFIISGIGMGMFFAPMANVTLSAVRPQEEGQGSFQSPQVFVDGMVPAVLMGSVFVAVGAIVAFAIPRARRADATDATLVVNAPSKPVEGDVAPAYLPIDD